MDEEKRMRYVTENFLPAKSKTLNAFIVFHLK